MHLFSMAFVLFLIFSSFGSTVIFYQGIFTDSTGKPLSVNDSLRAALHDSPSSIIPLWQETHFVSTKNGTFSVMLGSINPFPSTLFLNADSLFWEFTQKGRQKVSRSRVGFNAYTIRSLFADSAKKAAFADNSGKSLIADTAKHLSNNKWLSIDDSSLATACKLSVTKSIAISNSDNTSLSLNGILADTVICRARINAGANGVLSIDMSNASGTAEVKSLVTIRPGIDCMSVAGTVNALSFKASGVTLNVPDYVFQKSYELSPLSLVENYINANSHLPDIPSAKEINDKGLDVVDMNLRLLKKIEEMTLYLIDQEKRIKELEEKHK